MKIKRGVAASAATDYPITPLSGVRQGRGPAELIRIV